MRIKAPKNFPNRLRESPLRGHSLPKVEIFDILGAAFPPPVAIEVKFCAAKRTQVPVGPAKFDVNRCNESSLRAKNLIFGL